jgi:hypothetical protein
MLAALMPGLDMVNGQAAIPAPAVLAGIIIAPEHFPAGQLDPWAGTVNLFLEPDDRWTWQKLGYCADVAAPVHDHCSPAREDQADGPAGGTDVDGLKVRVEH